MENMSDKLQRITFNAQKKEVYVDGEVCKDPTKIGEAVLNNIEKAERTIYPMMHDYNYLIGLIELKKEVSSVMDWYQDIRKKHPKLECVTPIPTDPFSPNFYIVGKFIQMVKQVIDK